MMFPFFPHYFSAFRHSRMFPFFPHYFPVLQYSITFPHPPQCLYVPQQIMDNVISYRPIYLSVLNIELCSFSRTISLCFSAFGNALLRSTLSLCIQHWMMFPYPSHYISVLKHWMNFSFSPHYLSALLLYNNRFNRKSFLFFYIIFLFLNIG